MTEGNESHGPMPWYRSPVYIGIAVSIVSQILAHAPKVAAAFGLIDPTAISTVVTDIFNGIGFLAVLYAERKRANSKLQPLTLTNKGKTNDPPPPADRPPAGSDNIS
jgi:hypothetical protein